MLLSSAPISPSTAFFFFFLNDPSPPDIYTLPLPDALPICLVLHVLEEAVVAGDQAAIPHAQHDAARVAPVARQPDGVGVAAAHQPHRLRLLQLVQPLEREIGRAHV